MARTVISEGLPLIIGASSASLSSPTRRLMRVVVLCSSSSLYTLKWSFPIAATPGRCCDCNHLYAPAHHAAIIRAIRPATSPDTPVSTSSEYYRGQVHALRKYGAYSEHQSRHLSPPEAAPPSGIRVWFLLKGEKELHLVETVGTKSLPRVRDISHRRFGIPRVEACRRNSAENSAPAEALFSDSARWQAPRHASWHASPLFRGVASTLSLSVRAPSCSPRRSRRAISSSELAAWCFVSRE